MMPSYISGANITDLCGRLADNTAIDPKLYEKYHVKRGRKGAYPRTAHIQRI